MGWIDDLAAARGKKIEEGEKKALLEGMALQATPVMTRRLIERLKQDAEEFAKASGVKMLVSLDSSKLQINRSEFPSIFLQILVPQRGSAVHVAVIEGKATIRMSSGMRDDEKRFEIPIICGGQDAFYYRTNGGDVTSEAEASMSILKPLFEIL